MDTFIFPLSRKSKKSLTASKKVGLFSQVSSLMESAGQHRGQRSINTSCCTPAKQGCQGPSSPSQHSLRHCQGKVKVGGGGWSRGSALLPRCCSTPPVHSPRPRQPGCLCHSPGSSQEAAGLAPELICSSVSRLRHLCVHTGVSSSPERFEPALLSEF